MAHQNALARAHVGPAQEIHESTADPTREIYPTPDESSDERIANSRIERIKGEILSRKEKRESRKLLKQKEKEEKAVAAQDHTQQEDQRPSEATKSIGDDTEIEDDEEQHLSKNQQKKRAKRLQKRELKNKLAASSTSTSPSRSPSTTPQPLKRRKTDPSSDSSPSIYPTLPPAMPPTNFPLLICSIGNPGAQYAQTLHSAGHVITSTIRDRGLYTPFLRGLNGSVAKPDTTRLQWTLTGFKKDDGSAGLGPDEDDFTLWQSLKQMNISGPSVQKGWREWSAQRKARGQTGRLVVVHDELESELGKVTVKSGTASPRGHNGLKSVQASMGSTPWWRVGVGIGRPESRDANVVAKYVLRKMTVKEEKAMDRAAVDVLFALRKIAEGKA